MNEYELKDNTYSKIQLVETTRKIEIEIGDSKQPEFYPQFKTLHWDNECNFSVRLVDNLGETPTVETIEDKIVYSNSQIEARFYSQPGDEDGQFEFEILLKERPLINNIDFTIQSKGFIFGYQPALTQEEIDAGFNRPENVVGSYAVYHDSKMNNQVGGKHYRTGKAFHIYRPELIDANGNRTWADLKIDEALGLMTITMPEKFLDQATYPVIVDPTFGYTGAGASTVTVEDNIRMGRFQISENGTGVSITALIDVTTAAKNMKANVYQDETGETDVDVAVLANGETEQISVGTGASQSITFNYNAAPTFVSGTFYRISLWSVAAGGNGLVHFDSAIAGADAYSRALTYGAWPNPSGTLTNTDQARLSIYTTYTTASSLTTSTTSTFLLMGVGL